MAISYGLPSVVPVEQRNSASLTAAWTSTACPVPMPPLGKEPQQAVEFLLVLQSAR
ncbi:MAG: hypothetical protein IMW99_05935 [Firmicutes bacterium]|nr:hypothetical protein [Bacillota bacterium]